MKHFYLVRHGESESNKAQILYGSETKLTAQGVKQSQFLVRRFRNIPIDTIVASPYVRTKQTAELFNKELNKAITFSELLIELQYPAEMYGLSRTDPKSMLIAKEIRSHFHEPMWHYSDEENFEDLKIRGEKALAFLLSRQGNHIAVITHGKFMRMLISLMVYGDKLTSQAFEPFFHTFVTSNTGITLCLHDGKSWKIRSWNDHAHLGEIVDK
jgi:broad specificity phosphatase PhoE